MLLALDTSSAAVTVAVARGADVLAEHTHPGDRAHGEALAPAISQVLASAGVTRRDVSALAVGTGPGPYTGLRVGLVTARVLALALEVPVVGVCSLDVLAYAAVQEGVSGRFRVATDARRREVYWAGYDGSTRVSGPDVARPADVPGEGLVIGEGAQKYPELFPDRGGPLTPFAADLARWVAAGLPTTDPIPLYLRRPDVSPSGPRKTVLA